MKQTTDFKTKVKLQYAINLLKSLDSSTLYSCIKHLESSSDNLEQERADARKIVQIRESMDERLAKRRGLWRK